MLRTIQSNIDDRYAEGSPFDQPFLRSVTVFAVGDAQETRSSDTRQMLRARALDLLGVDLVAEGEADFDGAISIGAPFEVHIANQERHLVRIVDGPLAQEVVRAIRVVGSRSWV